MIYLLDTNAVSDFLSRQQSTVNEVLKHLGNGHVLGICRPVHYEVLRGLLWRNAMIKLHVFNEQVLPLFTWIALTDDWELAAKFWADARLNGKQISDPDLLLAALTYRMNAILVSSDTDFDALPVRREVWN